ncbi:MAG: DMT family transporter [Treponema sp.]|nr:DMT family transporter [Treponema sp.]
MWMLLTLVYALIKGAREICKKKALEKNSLIEVLLIYTFISFLICIPQAPDAMGLTVRQYIWVAVKAFVIFVAWIAGFKAIKFLPISMYGILDLSRVLFASFLGITILGETISLNKGIGLILVSVGLLFLKFNPFRKKEAVEVKQEVCVTAEGEKAKVPFTQTMTWFVFLAFLSCVLNAVSGLLDKILMKEMNSSQLQFWYTFFMACYYGIYALVTRAKISSSVWKNIWIWLLAIGLIVMDKALFIANGIPESQITVMTLIKQSSVVVAIIAGKFIFHEKDILHKIVCALIIIAGIVAGVM